MKNKLIISIVILFAISSKIQSQTIDLRDDDGHPQQDMYVQDMYNVLNQFEGTYLYTNGNTSLKIILQKKTYAYDGYMYEDLIVGEYKYIENGITKINTLGEMTAYYPVEQKHSIHANQVLQMGDYLCQGCVANEKRLLGGLVDGKHSAQVIFGKTVIGGQQV